MALTSPSSTKSGTSRIGNYPFDLVVEFSLANIAYERKNARLKSRCFFHYSSIRGSSVTVILFYFTCSAIWVCLTQAPAPPVIVSDAITGITHEALSGTAEANSTVTIYDGMTVLGTTTANPSGAWNFIGSLAVGTHALMAADLDAAGNMSQASSAVNVTIIAPATPPALPIRRSMQPHRGRSASM
jgi:hypothetical protein